VTTGDVLAGGCVLLTLVLMLLVVTTDVVVSTSVEVSVVVAVYPRPMNKVNYITNARLYDSAVQSVRPSVCSSQVAVRQLIALLLTRRLNERRMIFDRTPIILTSHNLTKFVGSPEAAQKRRKA